MECTKHVLERYTERIVGKDTQLDINSYISSNTDKIKEDISTMVERGTLLFRGKPVELNNKQPIRVYMCGTWILLVDDKQDVVITLYKVDLGLGEEFNKEYVSKLLEQLEQANTKLQEISTELSSQESTYNSIIEENTTMINKYRGIIKTLEDQNKAYQDVIKGNSCKRFDAEKEIRDTIATIIGKRCL